MQTTRFISSFVLALVIASAGAEGAKEPFFEGLGSLHPKDLDGLARSAEIL